MGKVKISKVVMIGAGNLASQLAPAIKKAGFNIVQIYSRTEVSAGRLGKLIGCGFTSIKSEICKDGDIYIFALADDALREFIDGFCLSGKIVVHTSGSLDLALLASLSETYGILYPVQTFSKERKVNFMQIPVCIEASDDITKQILFDFAETFSSEIYFLNSEQRGKLHIAAVFACNFVNHLYTVSSEILSSADLPFDLIRPLIRETANKINDLPPDVAQTGPAVRNDQLVIKRHLDLLSFLPQYKKIYELITEDIISSGEKSR